MTVVMKERLSLAPSPSSSGAFTSTVIFLRNRACFSMSCTYPTSVISLHLTFLSLSPQGPYYFEGSHNLFSSTEWRGEGVVKMTLCFLVWGISKSLKLQQEDAPGSLIILAGPHAPLWTQTSPFLQMCINGFCACLFCLVEARRWCAHVASTHKWPEPHICRSCV